MIPVRLQQVPDIDHEQAAVEVVQQPCDSGETCLELWQDGCKVDECHLCDEMFEVFINLEAAYRQQGIDDSAVRAFRQLASAGKNPH